MNKPWHSRRAFLATGATLTSAAIAGCIGAPASGEPASGEPDASDESPEAGEIRIESLEDLEEPTGGSDLAGSAGAGEPDWIDAHNMRFRGWFDVNDYNHRIYDFLLFVSDDQSKRYGSIDPNRMNLTLACVNLGGYVMEATVTDDNGDELYDWTLPLRFGFWFHDDAAKNAKIRVVGSAQNEALNIDLTNSNDHLIWLGGAVLTANYWVGHW